MAKQIKPQAMARDCLQGRIRIRADHVIADMVASLGGHIEAFAGAFDPEAGAYAGGHHDHHDDHEHWGAASAARLAIAGISDGAFAYNHGLEWAVEVGDVQDEQSLTGWLTDVLTHGSGRNDAILLRHAHKADPPALGALCALGAASAVSRERQDETLALGAAFERAAAIWGGARLSALAEYPAPYPVAVGALAADHGIDLEMVTAGYLQAMASSLISAALRLVLLGQTAGLRVLAALEPMLAAVVAETADAALDDIGGACIRGGRVHSRRDRRHAAQDAIHEAVPHMTQLNGPLRVGIGGPVGTGKTALIDTLCKPFRERYQVAAITNDIYTKEDAEFLLRAESLAPERIIGIETGGCPHTAIREDASMVVMDRDARREAVRVCQHPRRPGCG